MAIATLIIGNSGTGKSSAMRNMSAETTLLNQVVRKPLPFRSKSWGYFSKENKAGNIVVTDQWNEIIQIARKTSRKRIVLDDFQYMLANEFMRRSEEKGFDKFTEIGRHAWEVITELSKLPDDVRVYILAHSNEDDHGNVRMKTIGKLLDEKIAPEGLFTIVLRTFVSDGKYQFSTQNCGNDTVKSPIGLFEEARIDNDLEAVDKAIVDYYGITNTTTEAQKKAA
jgi:hypothetical protein